MMSPETRVTCPLSSGVVRWLNAVRRRNESWPTRTLSMFSGATRASTTRASSCGTTNMSGSLGLMTPPMDAPRADARCRPAPIFLHTTDKSASGCLIRNDSCVA
jgi:hypothetical protein